MKKLGPEFRSWLLDESRVASIADLVITALEVGTFQEAGFELRHALLL
eukprot:CAMPEP_0180341928 /NCGR_PEP_ID=MMETSP0989-20121125/1472_1 /TAXON_ID=697907 /ORGANISM="non described non described, Strain CCMP2293" /LENGTH=47 /DNA_ID= /DNA_START= /DNA_END= /DNA_ORIENTATION=